MLPCKNLSNALEPLRLSSRPHNMPNIAMTTCCRLHAMAVTVVSTAVLLKLAGWLGGGLRLDVELAKV